MAHDVYDLVVRVQNEIIKYRKERRHSAYIDALIKGTLTGINFGREKLMAGGVTVDKELLKILIDPELSISDLIYQANSHLPIRKFFHTSLFVGGSYRQSVDCSRYYGKGIRWGYTYVMDLFEALKDPSTDEGARTMAIDYLSTVLETLRDF